MKSRFATLTTLTALAFATSALASPARAQQANPATAQVAKPTAPAPDVAEPKVGGDGIVNPAFQAAHDRFVATAKEGKARLVFLGDSITEGWGGSQDIWNAAFSKFQPANFGIGGDRTQHVLWRIENGELEGFEPKAFVVMIGTNNAGSDSAEGIAKGITAIVKTIREKQPQAHILLLAVFPRGEKASPNPAREKLTEVNATIAKLDDGKHVHYLDISEKFLQPDGSISQDVMPDYLHLSQAGYQIWADAISPKLAELMK